MVFNPLGGTRLRSKDADDAFARVLGDDVTTTTFGNGEKSTAVAAKLTAVTAAVTAAAAAGSTAHGLPPPAVVGGRFPGDSGVL